MFAASATLTLAGCATSGSVTTVNLPSWPAHCVPAEVADPRTGEPAVAVAARERAARFENARRLESCGEWYDSIRSDLANM